MAHCKKEHDMHKKGNQPICGDCYPIGTLEREVQEELMEYQIKLFKMTQEYAKIKDKAVTLERSKNKKSDSIEDLIIQVEEIAKEKFDGHYTIFSFTTNYKATFNTVDDPYSLHDLKGHPTLRECLIDLILNQHNAFNHDAHDFHKYSHELK